MRGASYDGRLTRGIILVINDEYFQAVQDKPAGHCRDTKDSGAEEAGCIRPVQRKSPQP